MVAVAALACWCFTIPPPERADRLRAVPLADYEFDLRLPRTPGVVNSIQPYVNETPFPFLKLLESFSDDAYLWWYFEERFLLYTCVEWGL